MTHASMPAASCIVLLIVALMIDLLSVGPASVRDRLAFLIALPALYAGWSGQPLAVQFNSALGGVAGLGLSASGSDSVAAVAPAVAVSALVAGAFVYAVGAVLPARAQRYAGRLAKYDLAGRKLGRMNLKLWGLALFLALTADLPRGATGVAISATMHVLVSVTAGVPNWLIGSL